MSNLLCPKCLKYLYMGGLVKNVSLFCQCPPPNAWTVSLTLTNGTVYSGTTTPERLFGEPPKSDRIEVPAAFREAFKDNELDIS